jgi:hypothetical protein
LRDEYTRTIAPARALAAETLNLERTLSDLVNQAYALTPAEIELIWQTAPPRMPIPAPRPCSPPLNPKGIPPQSPGLRAASYPGLTVRDSVPTPTGLWPPHAQSKATTPLGLAIGSTAFPRVARGSQPWAGGHNPFGIEVRVKQNS